MEFRAFVAKAPHLTIPRQRTLVYGGKLIFSNAAAKLPKAISQKRHDGFSFLNDGNLDKCLSKKKIRLATPALWLSSPHWAKCMTKSKFFETAWENYCTHTSAPRHVPVPRSRNFSDWSVVQLIFLYLFYFILFMYILCFFFGVVVLVFFTLFFSIRIRIDHPQHVKGFFFSGSHVRSRYLNILDLQYMFQVGSNSK